jgi:hypothetical protein
MVPIFVAAMVWLVRVLIIGTFSVAGERLFSLAENHASQPAYRNQPAQSYAQHSYNPAPKPQSQPYQQPYRAPQTNNLGSAQASFRPAPKPTPTYNNERSTVEPTYHPVGMSASSMERGERNNNSNSSLRR